MPSPVLRDLETGWSVLEVRGELHVPGYDPEEVGRGLPETTFRREVLGDWTAAQGKVVYPEWDGLFHAADEPLDFDPKMPLVCGWDLPGANGGTPAWVPTQLARTGQWLIFPSVCGRRDETIGMWDFGRLVHDHLLRNYALPYGVTVQDLRLIHYGDPAGRQKPVKTAAMVSHGIEVRSAYEILREGERVVVEWDERDRPVFETRPGFGFLIEPGEVSLVRRLEAVRSRLSLRLPGGLPALVVDPGAVMIRDGFSGGYHYHQRATGVYEPDPMKNEYSEPMDAISYVASKLFLANPDPVGAGADYGRPVTRAASKRRSW